MADTSTSADYTITVTFKDGGRQTQWPLVAGSSGSTQIKTYSFKTVPLTPAEIGVPTGSPPVATATGHWTAIAIDKADSLVFLGLSLGTASADGDPVAAYSIDAVDATTPATPKPKTLVDVPSKTIELPPAPGDAAGTPSFIIDPVDMLAQAGAKAGATSSKLLITLPPVGEAYVGSAVSWFRAALSGNTLYAINLTASPVSLEVFAGYSS